MTLSTTALRSLRERCEHGDFVWVGSATSLCAALDDLDSTLVQDPRPNLTTPKVLRLQDRIWFLHQVKIHRRRAAKYPQLHAAAFAVLAEAPTMLSRTLMKAYARRYGVPRTLLEFEVELKSGWWDGGF